MHLAVSEELCNHTYSEWPLYASLHFSFSGTNSDSDGNIGNILLIVSTLEGMLTARPWIDPVYQMPML